MQLLKKDLGFGITARLDETGTLHIVEESCGFNALEEEVATYTEIPLPAQAVRALLNLLLRAVARRILGYRKGQGRRPQA